MKRFFKNLLKFFIVLIGLLIIVVVVSYLWFAIKDYTIRRRLGPEVKELTVEGNKFRDLNKNGKLDPYEDWRLPIDERVQDLIPRLTLQEKAGLMFHPPIAMGKNGELTKSLSSFSNMSTLEVIVKKKIKTFNTYSSGKPEIMAEWHNKLQKLAEKTRLGIPISISSDPIHGYQTTSSTHSSFSSWPEPIGLAAMRDTSFVYTFGRIASEEYRAVGFVIALHPMADLATEPRWARINGTFGEDAELSSIMTRAYIKGFQGDSIGPYSVICMTKHFSGGGPQKDGWDAHFDYGQDQIYPGDNFDYHLIPFEAAIRAGTGQIMPYYGVPVGQTSEDVGMSFNKEIITDLLRGKYGFDGVVCTDWGIITPYKFLFFTILKARAWGVEDLTPKERIKKAINAGVDQFGGEAVPELIVELVEEGAIDESRIDQSVIRILRDKFRLGLFDNPYVDPQKAKEIVGCEEFREWGKRAQLKSLVLLTNKDKGEGKILPLKKDIKIYLKGIDEELASRYAQVVNELEDADVAIIRLNAPYEPREGNFLERYFHQGALTYETEKLDSILSILERKPTIVNIYLDRPAVIPEIKEKAAAILGNFGASDEAILDVIFGNFNPQGQLPFEMPSSMDAVREQKEDLPYDSYDPLFKFGYGLSYK